MDGRIAFVEAPAGLSGDMLLGALVDLGVPVDLLADLASRLGVDGLGIQARAVTKGSLAATKVDVQWAGRPIGGHAHDQEHAHDHGHDHDHAHDHGLTHDHAHDHDHEPDVHVVDPAHHHGHDASDHHHDGHRHLADVRALLQRVGPLDVAPLARAWAAFRHLAEAEGKVHGVPAEAVHFHEVGAVDAIVDIAGVCAGFHHLGVQHVIVGPLPWGRGTIRCAHGTMPNPAPATVHLLMGHPTVPSAATYEQVTPTGAALVRALADGHELPPGFVPEAVGLGAGAHPGQGLPNVVRVTLGRVRRPQPTERVWQLETNVDDVAGSVLAYALHRVRAAGALDAWTVPVTMKKGRPGVVVCALVDEASRAPVEDILLAETGTLGVRAFPVERRVLARAFVSVETAFGTVRIKVRSATGEGVPELEDCRRLAEAAAVPLRHVLRAAEAAYDASR